MNFVNSLENKEKQVLLHSLFQQIMDSGHYSEGEQTELAEEELTNRIGTPTVLLNSCGSALFACYQFYKSRGHRKVIIQNNTFYATASTAVEAGLEVYLCDVREDDPSMSLESLKKVLDRVNCSLVVLTHVGGWAAKDYQDIAEFCAKEKITLLVDAAHTFGVEGASRGGTTCWSFYPTKSVPIGEGGAVSSEDKELLKFVKRYRSYGKHLENGIMKYDRGINLRVSEWDAAVLRVQLKFIHQILQARREDAVVLQLIAPCLLSGLTNWYKYVVDAKYEKLYRTVGKVYARTDQLDVILGSNCKRVVPLFNSIKWAYEHCCLPISEGLYSGLNNEEVERMLAL